MFRNSLKIYCLRATLVASFCAHALAYEPIGSSFGIPGDNVTYDYVVVGGGTAGLAIATRLVQQNVGTVAVIEAGTFYETSNGNISQVPATGVVFSGKGPHDFQPLIDWGYMTTPQAGGFNQSLHYARGKTFGGSSARNFMVYQRGTEGSHKLWSDIVGSRDYTWENFLPFFKKSVNFTGPNMAFRFTNSTPEYSIESISEKNGPLSVTFSHYAQAFGTWATEGLKQIGIPVIQGFLGGRLLGQSYSTFTINADTMIRDSSETSFLREGLGNSAYKLHPLAMANKVLFDENKKATGVIVETEGIEYVLSARKEGAGVFGSPQLLMVSGVGPAATLDSLNIPVIADRPGVGQGMQDHVFYGISYRVNAPTISSLQIPSFAAEQAKLYENAAGMYASPNTDVLAWEKIPRSLRHTWSNKTRSTLDTYPADWPEVEYIAISSYLGSQINSRSSDPNDGFNYATLAIALVAPRSRGTITIKSPDAKIAPVINPNWLTDRADVDVAVAAFKRGREFFKTPAMQSFVIGGEYFPGMNVTTDDQIEQFIRKSFNTIWHAACTCAMGKTDDIKAVVDAQARVIGVKGLRVVDASAFPLLPPGHPMSTVCKFLV
ncbi:putative glucose-methanol-choline oxidoreductase [Xylariaceae sp. FL0662B]|nr:putative glucose-methanol-choline oxidoreductase [Xylariaceae sp. FL0662B]